MKLNNKGFSLIEIVITIAILGIVTSVIYSIFQFGIDSYYSGSNYSTQQDKVVDAIQFLRSQVEESKSIKYYISNDGTEKVLILANTNLSESEMISLYLNAKGGTATSEIRTWKFGDGKLMLMSEGNTSYKNIIGELDTANCGFKLSNQRLVIIIKPAKLNNKYKNRNINEPIETEISVRYKNAS